MATPLTSGFSRVFFLEGRARPNNAPDYQTLMKGGSPTQDFGDVTPIKVPSSLRYGKFDEIGQVRGEKSRATVDLMGRYLRDARSELLRLARQGCPLDIQFHTGLCQDPREFNKFDKIVVMEQAYLTSWTTSNDIGALAEGDQSEVDESAPVSALDMYEILPLTLVERAGSTITNEALDAVIADLLDCGDCESATDGCQKIYVLTTAAGGSPGTPADVVFSLDGGGTWYARDIDTLGAAEAPSAIAKVGAYMVVVANSTDSLHYALKTELDDITTDEAWTEVSTGFVAAGSPNDIWSVGFYAFICGDGGYVYGTSDPTAGVTVLESGSAVSDNLNAVHALDDQFAVAVGDSGAVIRTRDQTSWAAMTRPTGAGVDLNCVWVKSERQWWVGASNGRLYYTLDGGTTWTEKTFSGSGAGQVRDIQFATASVAYMAHSTAAPAGRIFRSLDGGYTWYILPEAIGVTIPANDYVAALATCWGEPNLVVGAGLADDASDGFVVVGS